MQTDSKFKQWLNSGNVYKTPNNLYKEQSTQYKRAFTLRQLKRFYFVEFILPNAKLCDK